MDSNTSSYFLNHTTFSSAYHRGREGGGIIDLGLSLGTVQSDAYHSSGNDDFSELIEWQQLHPQLKSPRSEYPRRTILENYDDKTEGVQSKERWAYVKVNLDGVIVGRKICILDHMDYSSLAMQLDDMFGRQLISGLRLFQAGSEFSLFYKDRNEKWRVAGRDVPWKEFVDRVKRLRIVRKDEASISSSSTFV